MVKSINRADMFGNLGGNAEFKTRNRSGGPWLGAGRVQRVLPGVGGPTDIPRDDRIAGGRDGAASMELRARSGSRCGQAPPRRPVRIREGGGKARAVIAAVSELML